MSRLVSRAESWERVYSAFATINFSAFDYNTIKQSLIDNIKLNFPETFNDFIESSELIAIIESFAYIAELLAYRMDVVSHENFLSTAQRRDSVLKLAKMISYKASRQMPARGLVKITSISTTETIFDANNINLAGRTIRWNDFSNVNWKDQFLLVMNRVMLQEFGTVSAVDRFQINDVLFETYPLATTQDVLPYSASVFGQVIPMELVPVIRSTTASGESGIRERRPQANAAFTIMYGNDGLGDGSETTGFLCFTKQGILERYRAFFDGITPNQSYDIPSNNINDTDVWVNCVDPSTGDIIVKPSNQPYRRETTEGKYGEWIEVDIAHSQNVIFNTNPKRNKYEIETFGDSSVRLLFGDGEFADIPAGHFDIWARVSVNEDLVIPQTSVSDVPMSFTYLDMFGQVQTFSFTISLIGSLTNASAAESTEHIRQTAPSVYYTQDRMVNGEDYNVYMRQDPSILKLRAINRTFAGDSKYITWHDSSNSYENVKIFGTDAILYMHEQTQSEVTPAVTDDALISTYIEPLITSTDMLSTLTSHGVPISKLRRGFTENEVTMLRNALSTPPSIRNVELNYNMKDDTWYSYKSGDSVDRAVALLVGSYQIVSFGGLATPNTPVHFDPIPTGYSYGFNVKVSGSRTLSVVLSQQQTASITTLSELIAAINQQIGQYVTTSVFNGDIILRDAVPALNTELSIDDVNSNTIKPLFLSLQSSPTIQPPVFANDHLSGFIDINTPLITVTENASNPNTFVVSRSVHRMVIESHTTKFWNTNDAKRVIDYSTASASQDVINILQANTNCNRNGILKQDLVFNVLAQELIDSGPDSGLPDIHRISVAPADTNGDMMPDYTSFNDFKNQVGVANIIKPKIRLDLQASVPPVSSADGKYGDGKFGDGVYAGMPLVSSADGKYGDGKYGDGVYAGTHAGTNTNMYTYVITLPLPYVAGESDVTVHDEAENILPGPIYIQGIQVNRIDAGTAGHWAETDAAGEPVAQGALATHIKISLPVSTFYVKDDEGIAKTDSNGNYIIDSTKTVILYARVNEYVYHTRTSIESPWQPAPASLENITQYLYDRSGAQKWRRSIGRANLNFMWAHYSPRYHLVDPSPTNIIDIFVITRGYYASMKRWLEDPLAVKPTVETPYALRQSYSKLLDNKMVSDTVVLHPGKIKLLFGAKADTPLRATFKVIKSSNSIMTDNQIKNQIVATVRNFFDIASFEFGETFYFTELAAAIHMDLPTEISSIVLVPTDPRSQFGELLHVIAREDEILYPDITPSQIEIVSTYTTLNLQSGRPQPSVVQVLNTQAAPTQANRTFVNGGLYNTATESYNSNGCTPRPYNQ